MTIEVYIASAYMVGKYDGHEENDRVLRFAEKDGVKYIGLNTPDFFPSIKSNLERMPKGEIEINETDPSEV
jgi:hypothetical protein